MVKTVGHPPRLTLWQHSLKHDTQQQKRACDGNWDTHKETREASLHGGPGYYKAATFGNMENDYLDLCITSYCLVITVQNIDVCKPPNEHKKIWCEKIKGEMNGWINKNTKSALICLLLEVLLYPQETVWHGYLMDETQTQCKNKDDIDNLTSSSGATQYVQLKTPRPISLKEDWLQSVKQSINN